MAEPRDWKTGDRPKSDDLMSGVADEDITGRANEEDDEEFEDVDDLDEEDEDLESSER
jgi:hypothetical protein